MKTIPFYALLIGLFSFLCPKAQDLQIKQTKLKDISYLNYLGQDDKFIYYSSGSRTITRFSKTNLSDKVTYQIGLDKDDMGYANIYFTNNVIFVVTSDTETDEKSKMKTTDYFIYKLNTSNGEKIKKVNFNINDSANRYYSCKVDTVPKLIFIKKSDSIFRAFNYDLEETNDRVEGKIKSKPESASGLVKELERLMSQMNFRFSFNIEADKANSQNDSLSMDYYVINFDRRTDKDIYQFESVIQKIVITSKNKENKVQSVELAIDVDKSIIDINYREDKNGRLYVFGKYIVKGKTASQYGLFSTIYDQKLNQVSAIKYFDLCNIQNIDRLVPNQKFVGFIFEELFEPDYEFYLEDEDIFIFTYQRTYTNLQDHIYLLKLEPNGEITVNIIVNQMKTGKSKSNEKHIALRAGNKIHILFYDHKDNLGKEARDIEFTACEISKKTCAFVYTTYNVMEDDFTTKTLLSDPSLVKAFPDSYSQIHYYDSKNNQNVCIVKGYNKKNKLVSLFEFFYTN